MNREWHPRLSVEITEQQYRDLERLIPWGNKKKVFGVVVDDVIRHLKRHGEKFIAAVLHRHIKLEDYTAMDIGDEENGDNR